MFKDKNPFVSVFAVGLVVGLTAGCPLETTTKDDTTTPTTPDNPLNFTAVDGNSDCVYEKAISGSQPDFTLDYGSANGFEISASGFVNYQGPPNSLEISYGSFNSGQITVFPLGGGAGVTENAPSDWTVTWTGSAGASTALPYGDTWQIEFSCGAIPSCCDETTSIQVVASGTP